MPGSEALERLRNTVGGFLRASFGDAPADSDGDFVVRRDGAVVWVRLFTTGVMESPSGPVEGTIVLVWAVPNVGMRVDAELTRYLATEAMNLPFGQFELDEQGVATVHLSHALLGEYLSREELEVAVSSVASSVARYGPVIKERFGGVLSSELAMSSTGTAPSQPDRTRHVQARFAVIAVLAAIGAAVSAYLVTSSWALPIFVFLMTLYLVARGVPDVITDPQKLKRALYFLAMPAVAAGVLALAYWWWDRWWLAVLLGFVVGVPLGVAAAVLGFPRIAEEEIADDEERARRRRVGA
jgi:hypothetical protein